MTEAAQDQHAVPEHDVEPRQLRAALSPSRAGDFMQCPLLYRFRVVDRIPEEPSAAAARGTLVHAVLERIFDAPPAERTIEAATELLGPQWQRMLEREPVLAELLGDDPEERATWFAEATALLRRWFTLEDPTRLEPAERELYVEAEIDGLTLRGYVDRLDEAPGQLLRVVDYKTGRSPSELFEAKALFQMKFYALVLWRSRGVLPRMLQLVYLGNGELVRYEPDESDLLATERKVKALWAAIERAATTGDWRPRRSRLCDWCDHQSRCPEFGGTPPPLPEHAVQLALDPVRAGGTSPADGDDN
ncbi:RecB family exonuclease [Flexivirga meconopsidis]|uniref:RecB family exonuclease n=1 Tax=Flexivirga meconopsidis TaxID=2977121 RepID=UPI00223F5FE1|nr:PD-(D/E)XK nuclease family protein [Flexivirga meconopsidis]